MEGNYEIRMGQTVVGQAVIRRQGLYYEISAQCTISQNGIYRLMIECDGRVEKISVLIPMDGCFQVRKRMACKHFGSGVPQFRIQAADESADPQRQFVPVYPEEPFSYIRQLENAYLARQDGQLGIMIAKKPTL